MDAPKKNNAVIRNTTVFIRNNYERHDGVDILIEDGIIKKTEFSIPSIRIKTRLWKSQNGLQHWII